MQNSIYPEYDFDNDWAQNKYNNRKNIKIHHYNNDLVVCKNCDLRSTSLCRNPQYNELDWCKDFRIKTGDK